MFMMFGHQVFLLRVAETVQLGCKDAVSFGSGGSRPRFGAVPLNIAHLEGAVCDAHHGTIRPPFSSPRLTRDYGGARRLASRCARFSRLKHEGSGRRPSRKSI